METLRPDFFGQFHLVYPGEALFFEELRLVGQTKNNRDFQQPRLVYTGRYELGPQPFILVGLSHCERFNFSQVRPANMQRDATDDLFAPSHHKIVTQILINFTERPGQHIAFGGKGIDPSTWTDDGSTYLELWGGLLPTFWDDTTIQPGQTFGWTERWYPVSGLGQGFDAANAAAALGWESRGDSVAVNVVTSTNLEGLVKLWQNGNQVMTWPVAIGPGRAFNGLWSGESGQRPVGVQLFDSTGKLVMQAGSVP